jgi:hypothetical protein
MLAAIRPSEWNWLLLFHLLFGFALVGGVLAVTLLSLAARGACEQVLLLRTLAFRTNLAVVLPAFVGVHILGQTLSDREFPNGGEPGWVGTAFGLTDAGLVLGGVVLTLLQWWVVRRTRAASAPGWAVGVATVLPPLVLALLVAIVFVMAGKP